MKIVIEVPEEAYNTRQLLHYFGCYSDKLDLVIYKGTPLPEHHGRLVDADWIKNTLDIYVINEYNGQFIRRNDIDSVPTIIEGSDSE